MAVVLGVDLGTTTITAVALDALDGKVLACCTRLNDAEITSPENHARGYSEWDADRIAETACSCLREVLGQADLRGSDVAGIAITGQQHGVVLSDHASSPRSLLISWQDRRGEQPLRGVKGSSVQRALELAGADAPLRTGCQLASGYLGVTLFWLAQNQAFPSLTQVCFLADHFAGRLTGSQPVTDPTFAASSGVFNIVAGAWDDAILKALGISRSCLPEVRQSGERLGGLSAEAAAALSLPTGVPVFVGVGDNQASFLGAVASPRDSVLVNVGTGGQVCAYTEQVVYSPLLETRPFPGGGFLLVSAGLCGGRAYALLEQFYRDVGKLLFGVTSAEPVFEAMNRLAAEAPRGAEGLCCAPFFAGSRSQPELRALWAGVSASNFTPGLMTRALLEGMAQVFRGGYGAIVQATERERGRLVGAGNGLRENPVLARILPEVMQMPLEMPTHREEAAHGAALLAAVGAGVQPDLLSASRLICYEEAVCPVPP